MSVMAHDVSAAPGVRADRRWFALAFIALAQLMLALDATIVNIALPSAQAALQFSDADRQWLITAYTLPFGGLLLLGGRVADSRLGRKRALLIGLAGFAVASPPNETTSGFEVPAGPSTRSVVAATPAASVTPAADWSPRVNVMVLP